MTDFGLGLSLDLALVPQDPVEWTESPGSLADVCPYFSIETTVNTHGAAQVLKTGHNLTIDWVWVGMQLCDGLWFWIQSFFCVPMW